MCVVVDLNVCLFVVTNPKPLTSPPAVGSKETPWEYIPSGSVALPAVLPKVHHRLEPLYVSSEVNTLQVDGLACIPGLTQALFKLFVCFVCLFVGKTPKILTSPPAVGSK